MGLDLDKSIELVKQGEILNENDLRTLCERVKDVFAQESNVTPTNAPVTIVGDLHGQFFDLLQLMKVSGGDPPAVNYVFLGDYVDRGHHSVETISYLLLLKVKYHSHVVLIRGNHETRQVSYSYGLYEECTRKYGNPNAWNLFMDVFDYMPISCLIGGKIFCVHGGLSPRLKRLDQINAIDRKMEVPHEGAFADMMWSDPDEVENWRANSRGAGYVFGASVVNEFNHINGLDLIARAHQLVNEGYKYWFHDENLVTVWSAPNYCYRCGNVASVLQISPTFERKFEVFKEVEDSAKVQAITNFMPYFL